MVHQVTLDQNKDFNEEEVQTDPEIELETEIDPDIQVEVEAAIEPVGKDRSPSTLTKTAGARLG